MKRYLYPPFLVTLGFFVVSCLWLKMAFELPFDSSVTSIAGPGTFPALVLSLMVVISLVLTVTEFLKARRGQREEVEMNRGEVVRVLLLMAVAALYVIVVDFTGYVPATVVLIALSLLLFGVKNKIVFTAVTVLFPAAIWVLFQILLKVQLP